MNLAINTKIQVWDHGFCLHHGDKAEQFETASHWPEFLLAVGVRALMMNGGA